MSTDLQKFTKQFAAKSGFEITFDVNAKNALIEKAIQQDKSIDAICKELFKDYEHGLAIISRNSGQSQWILPEDAVENPDKYLSDLVVKSFNKN